MPIIALIGPNAVGKTSAVTRWCKKYQRLVGCLCDSNQRVVAGQLEIEARSWKQNESRAALVEHYKLLSQTAVIVAEGASGYGLRIAKELDADLWIIITCSAQASRRQLQARCQQRGKTFRADYWTDLRLSYESERRHIKYARKNLPAERFVVAAVEEQAEDWPKVDQLFGTIYRRLNNELLRRK